MFWNEKTTDEIEARLEEYNERVYNGTMTAQQKKLYRQTCMEWERYVANEERPNSHTSPEEGM